MKSPEEVGREMVQEWLDQATEDLGLAEHLVSEKAPYLKAIAFHSQQAAEKYLKAFLVSYQCEFPKTHDIGELLDLVATVHETLAESLHDATDLNPYAVDARYPGDFPDVTETEARHALRLAQCVRDRVVTLLQEEKKGNPEPPRRGARGLR